VKNESALLKIIEALFIVASVLAFVVFMIKVFINEKKVPQEQSPNSNIFIEFLSRGIFPLLDT